MDIGEVRDLYDDQYAAGYDERFLSLASGRVARDFELSAMRGVLGVDGSLLDVACGTGWVLSQFPGHTRTGLDISPAMVAQARAANPDCEVREGDFRDGHLDWEGRWDLVSCMWWAYCYAETMREVEQLVENMARWTSPGGACFLPLCDFAARGSLVDLPYPAIPEVASFGGPLWVTGVTWSWAEPTAGKVHTHLIAPHEDHMTEAFARHFRRIEVLDYPRGGLGLAGRKAILATGKRLGGDSTRAEVVRVIAPDVGVDPTRGDGGAAPRASPGRRGPGALGRAVALRAVRALERRLAG